MKTQVAIIGGGPAGLLLSQLLHLSGIDSVVLERRSRDYVLGRIRAGVLESGSVKVLTEAGVGDRLAAEGQPHDGVEFSWHDERLRIDLEALTGTTVTVYGQTEVTRDLYAALDARGAEVIHEAEVLRIEGVETDAPVVMYRQDGAEHRLEARFVAGCDGFHGPSRKAMPDGVRQEFERAYPFGWLGLLSKTPPAAPELIYAAHERGFALCSMRSDEVSRYYVQVPVEEKVEDWTPERFWDELRRRIPADVADGMVTEGEVLEMSVAPLRSFVSEPMRHGSLFLAGDAAHIVPPTGAKGLNLAVSDVYYLHRALDRFFNNGTADGIDSYSETALARVWKVERFSWSLTQMMHDFPQLGAFEKRMQKAEFDYLVRSETARKGLAENYIGLPF
ncbi:4-hydroxybenzoate 3-monooxygenase [Maritalea mobilis]|uniref:4-hydroxybenzoate 3-monooxygenase n=1 Tax=Maritalea mobilis TaxID=483324 RepID=UPI001C98E22B|nr:4-hydroxybenzoate 3-monooxygenase [Maritalea mobilis]MBY6200169.1 4-hydroxybenzoate 3-monooxygenase [Maritalea mobilis]